MTMLLLALACTPDEILLPGGTSTTPAGPTAAPGTGDGPPAELATRPHPNGIAADDDHVYVVIGEPHSDPDSIPVGLGTTGWLQVFDAADGTLVTELEIAGGGHAMRLADGRLYVSHFSLDNVVTVIDTASLAVVAEVGGLLNGDIVVPDSLAVSADGRHVYVGSNGPAGGWLSRFDTATLEIDDDWRVPVEGGFTCWVQTGPDPDVVYANSWTGGTVQRADVVAEQTTAIADVGPFPHAVTVDPSGTWLYAMVSGGNGVLKLDATTLEEVGEVDGPWAGQWGGPVSGTLSVDGTRLFVANHALGQVAAVDLDEGSPTYDTVVETWEVGADPIFSAASPDGRWLYVANNAGASVSVIPVGPES